MLQAYAQKKPSLEEQFQVNDHLKISQPTTCDLELKNGDLEHQLAKDRKQLSQKLEANQC